VPSVKYTRLPDGKGIFAYGRNVPLGVKALEAHLVIVAVPARSWCCRREDGRLSARCHCHLHIPPLTSSFSTA
jgi:hypothetical protein